MAAAVTVVDATQAKEMRDNPKGKWIENTVDFQPCFCYVYGKNTMKILQNKYKCDIMIKNILVYNAHLKGIAYLWI